MNLQIKAMLENNIGNKLTKELAEGLGQEIFKEVTAVAEKALAAGKASAEEAYRLKEIEDSASKGVYVQEPDSSKVTDVEVK